MKLFDTLLGRSKPVRPKLDELFSLPTASITLQTTEGLVPTGNAGVCFKPQTGRQFEEMLTEMEQLLKTGSDDGADTSGTADAADVSVRQATDSFGYKWVLVEGAGIDDIVTRVHMVHTSITENGWGPQLLCSAFGFVHTDPGSEDTDLVSDGALASLAAATPVGYPRGEHSGASEGAHGNSGAMEDSGTSAADSASIPAGSNNARTLYLIYLAKRGTFYPFAPTGKEKRDIEAELRMKAVLGHDLPLEQDLENWFPLWDLPVH